MGLIPLVFCTLSLFQFISHKIGHKSHCRLSYLALITTAFHGLLAWIHNGIFVSAQMITGVVCIIEMLVLFMCYYLRMRHPSGWKKFHKVTALSLIIAIVIHLLTLF